MITIALGAAFLIFLIKDMVTIGLAMLFAYLIIKWIKDKRL